MLKAWIPALVRLAALAPHEAVIARTILSRAEVVAGMTFSVFSFFFSFSPPLHADFLVGPGATGSAFLKIPISARATAMGGAFTAVNGDVASLEYNPAGLSEIYRVDMNATLIRYLEDSKIQSFSAGFPVDFKKGNTLGDGFFGPDSDKIFMGLQYRSFEADDVARDNLGARTGDFDIKDQLLQIGMAYSPFERLAFGLAGKSISSKLAGESMSNLAFDAGFLWKFSGMTTAGASLLNMGQDKAFVSDPDPLPTTLRTGLGFQFKRILLTADLFSGRDKITQEALGLEIRPNRILRLRGGVINSTDLEVAGGVGVMFSPSVNQMTPADREKKKNKNILDDLNVPEENPVYQKFGAGNSTPMDLGIDYSIRTHSDFDMTHTFTLKILY